jgi:hypothetical protein
MSRPFEDLGLTQAQIDQNYTFKQIQLCENVADDKVFVDTAKFNMVVANVNNVFDNVLDDHLTIVGTDLDVDDSDQVIVIGNSMTINASDTIISIGNTIGIDNADNVINIGHDSSFFSGDNNVIVGNNNDNSGDNNVIIGHNIGTGGVNNNMVVVANDTVSGIVPSGSVIMGGGETTSALPRVQFLNSYSTPLQGAVAGNAFDNAVTFALPPINGYMRVKYKNRILLLPCLLDPDDATTSPAPIP